MGLKIYQGDPSPRDPFIDYLNVHGYDHTKPIPAAKRQDLQDRVKDLLLSARPASRVFLASSIVQFLDYSQRKHGTSPQDLLPHFPYELSLQARYELLETKQEEQDSREREALRTVSNSNLKRYFADLALFVGVTLGAMKIDLPPYVAAGMAATLTFISDQYILSPLSRRQEQRLLLEDEVTLQAQEISREVQREAIITYLGT